MHPTLSLRSFVGDDWSSVKLPVFALVQFSEVSQPFSYLSDLPDCARAVGAPNPVFLERLYDLL